MTGEVSVTLVSASHRLPRQQVYFVVNAITTFRSRREALHPSSLGQKHWTLLQKGRQIVFRCSTVPVGANFLDASSHNSVLHTTMFFLFPSTTVEEATHSGLILVAQKATPNV